MATDDEVTCDAIRRGLSPRTLMQMLCEFVPNDLIANRHGLDMNQLKMIARRWELSHLLGREKSNMTITRHCNER